MNPQTLSSALRRGQAFLVGRHQLAMHRTDVNEEAYYIAHAPGAGRTRKIRLVKEWLLEEAKWMLAST